MSNLNEKLAELCGWEVFESVIFPGKWTADHPELENSLGYLTKRQLIALAQKEGGEG